MTHMGPLSCPYQGRLGLIKIRFSGGGSPRPPICLGLAPGRDRRASASAEPLGHAYHSGEFILGRAIVLRDRNKCIHRESNECCNNASKKDKGRVHYLSPSRQSGRPVGRWAAMMAASMEEGNIPSWCSQKDRGPEDGEDHRAGAVRPSSSIRFKEERRLDGWTAGQEKAKEIRCGSWRKAKGGSIVLHINVSGRTRRRWKVRRGVELWCISHAVQALRPAVCPRHLRPSAAWHSLTLVHHHKLAWVGKRFKT